MMTILNIILTICDFQLRFYQELLLKVKQTNKKKLEKHITMTITKNDVVSHS